MKQKILMEKYPIFVLELLKVESKFQTTNEIVSHFENLINNHKIASFIAVFDHFSHTKALNGDMAAGLIDAKNIIFCFGSKIPNPEILSVRPRSIGVCEFEDKFIISFLETPTTEINETLENWAKSIKK